MCWSIGASAVLAIIGFVYSYILIKKKESTYLWLAVLYFAVMESLQALSYPVIGQCGLPQNQILAYLSYIHIAFQPIVINAFALYFIPKHFRKKIQHVVFGLAFIAGVLLLVKVYPFGWAGSCEVGSGLCGEQMCTISGTYHLGWTIPMNGIEGLGDIYFLAGFILPMLFGAWRLILLLMMPSYVIAWLTSSNPNEVPAIWCLLSIITILIAFIPKAREFFKVKKYYFWKFK